MNERRDYYADPVYNVQEPMGYQEGYQQNYQPEYPPDYQNYLNCQPEYQNYQQEYYYEEQAPAEQPVAPEFDKTAIEDEHIRYLNETKKNSDFRHQVDQYVCRELASVQYVFASGANNASTNDSYYTTVELTVDGADYEGVFDVMTGEKLAKYFTSVYAPSALMKR